MTSVSVDPSIRVSVIESVDYDVYVPDSVAVDGDLNSTASNEDHRCIESSHNNQE